MEELKEAMEKLNPEDVQKALEKLEVSAEDLLKSLERTESLLKEIQREQEMEEHVRKTKDLMDEQEQLHDETSDADEGDPQEMDELAGEQEELSKKAQELENEMCGMNELTDDEQLAQEMQAASEQMQQDKMSENMKKASDQLKSQQKQDAMQSQSEAMQKLIALFSKMVDFQMSMQSGSQRRMGENLQRLAKSTLDVSFKQEKLMNRLRDQISSEDAANTSELSQEQNTYLKAVRQIADELDQLSQKSLAVPEPLLLKLGETIDKMQQALLFLEQRKAFMSTASASEAVTNLNLITMDLLSACQQCQSGASGGQPGAMPKLQQLLSGQQQILQESKSLAAMRAMQEKMLQERQARLERLSGQQRSLQELAKEMEQELKDNRRLLGRMDKIEQEMGEVLRDLESGLVDEETIRNEEQILSRLLDAQRSVHSRDYEKKRLSVSADDIFSERSGAASKKQTPQSLREEIRRAMTLKAPGEFEDLIKLYFRALAEESPDKSAVQ
jgi:hypothetical protein